MLRWYNLSLINLVTHMIFYVLDRRYKILPLTWESSKIFGIYLAVVIFFWVFIVGPYLGFEGSAAQMKEFICSAISLWPINALASRFLLERRD